MDSYHFLAKYDILICKFLFIGINQFTDCVYMRLLKVSIFVNKNACAS